MTVILIDAKNACFRFGYAHAALSWNGQPTGVLYGIVSCILRLKKKYRDSMFVMVWDEKAKDGKTWRHKLMPNYKHRVVTDQGQANLLEAVSKQIPSVKEFCRLTGIPNVGVPGVEADDLIGMLSRKLSKYGLQIVIYSSDKDFIQLIPYGVDLIRDVKKEKKLSIETLGSIAEKFKCAPKDVLKVRAICGDPSDRIGGAVRGLGPITAAKLVANGVDPSFPRRPEHEDLRKAWSIVRRNYRLMKIVRSPDSKVFSEEIRKEVNKAIGSVCIDLALESGVLVDKSKRVYREMVDFLAAYGLESAIENRMKLWELQSRKM